MCSLLNVDIVEDSDTKLAINTHILAHCITVAGWSSCRLVILQVGQLAGQSVGRSAGQPVGLARK